MKKPISPERQELRTITRDIVGAVLISKDGKVLLGKTAAEAHGVYSGSWVLPGGGIDEGETREQAVIREVLEETHHDISGAKLELIDDSAKGQSEKVLKDTGERVLVEMSFCEYKVVLDKTAEELGIKPSEELVELRWFDERELQTANLALPTRQLFEKMNMV